MTRPPDLPNYHNPPIDEVAIGVQFAPINGLTEPYFGLFWSAIRELYPRVESKPRVEGPIENLFEAPSPVPQFQFVPPTGRTWYISEDDESLVQLQNNRFVQNWRRRNNDYPHFEAVRDRFWSSFRSFRDLLAKEDLSSPNVQQLELTYINWIPNIPAIQLLRIGQASVMKVEDIDAEPEAQDWSARYMVRSEGNPSARLYVGCHGAVRVSSPNPGQGTQLTLVYRAPALAGMDDDELKRHLDKGRRAIVTSFTALTTEAAHKSWQRFQ